MKKFFTLLLALVMTAAIGVTMSGCSKELIGFDIELAKAVADKLGVGVSFVEINWDTKEAELDNRSIDAAWNGFTYTKARDEGYFDEDRNQQIGGLDFTGMYMEIHGRRGRLRRVYDNSGRVRKGACSREKTVGYIHRSIFGCERRRRDRCGDGRVLYHL